VDGAVLVFGVCCWLGFDSLNEIELNVLLLSLGAHDMPKVLGIVVAANAFPRSMPRNELIERTHNPCAKKR
jgi:hypothetical protein